MPSLTLLPLYSEYSDKGPYWCWYLRCFCLPYSCLLLAHFKITIVFTSYYKMLACWLCFLDFVNTCLLINDYSLPIIENSSCGYSITLDASSYLMWLNEFLHLHISLHFCLRKAQQVDTQRREVSYSNWNPFPQAQRALLSFQEP